MQEQIQFQSVLITGQQTQVGRLQTQPVVSPIDPLDNLAYSNSNYFIQKNLPIDYENQKSVSYHQQNNGNQQNERITAKHSASQKKSLMQLKKSKNNEDSDSGNEDAIFCGVNTDTKPKSIQIDLEVEQTKRGGSDYGVCRIF